MKLLTITVPCYNSQDYMEKCVESLVVGGDEVEILVVDDGSVDRTAEIADRLQDRYPGIVRAIHQPNKGHGGAVNTGLENASGLYFKVVDSDDKLKASAYRSILDKLREYKDAEEKIDLLISNFVYDKEGQTRKKVMQYRSALPVNRMFSWDETRHFRKGQYILMHSVIYRTQLLKECGMRLPEHCFYVDNIYVFEPMPSVKNMYYRSGSEWVREWASNYILPEIAGCVNKNTYKGICDLFGLNPEKYLLKEKPKQEEIAIKKVPAKPDVSNATIVAKLDELIMAINKLGNIEMQNMEYLKALTKK